MARKMIIAVTAAVLIGALTLLAAQKAQKKESTELKTQVKAVEETPANPVQIKAKGPKCPAGLLDELKAAYEANDREKMGQIIQKMEQRREKMQKLIKFEKWHKWAHHRMNMRGYGRHQGWQKPGCGEAQRSPGWDCCVKDAFGPPAREYRHMKPWREGPPGRCPPGPRCPVKDLPPAEKPAPEAE